MTKTIRVTGKSDNFPLSHLHKSLKSFKAPYLSAPVKPRAKYIDHSLLVGNNADIKIHIHKLEKYLETHPNDIEVKTQIEKLKEIFNFSK